MTLRLSIGGWRLPIDGLPTDGLPIDGLPTDGLPIDGLPIVDGRLHWRLPIGARDSHQSQNHQHNLQSSIRRSPITNRRFVDRQSPIGNRQ